MTKMYLAGPMTNIPQFNFPAFEAAATALRAAGFEIISPHEQDSADVQKASWASKDGKLNSDMIAGESWGEILARDVRIVSDHVDGVILLDGWEKSRGARLEVFVGLLTGKTFQQYVPGGVSPQYSKDYIRQIIRENMP